MLLLLVLIDWRLGVWLLDPEGLFIAATGGGGCLFQESRSPAVSAHEERDRARAGLLSFGRDHPGSF